MHAQEQHQKKKNEFFARREKAESSGRAGVPLKGADYLSTAQQRILKNARDSGDGKSGDLTDQLDAEEKVWGVSQSVCRWTGRQ